MLDTDGHVTELYGRKILNNLKAGTPLHLYLPGQHRGVWNEAGLADCPRDADGYGEVILCEALIDSITFWQAGYQHVTSSYGVSGFTADHLQAFSRHRIKRVLIAYDRDEAGDRAALALAQQLKTEHIECHRIHFPQGMDANQYALQQQPAHVSLGQLIRSAVWLGDAVQPNTLLTAHVRTTGTESIVTITAPDQTETTSFTAASPAATASPVIVPVPSVDYQQDGDNLHIHMADRQYRVRGLAKNLASETLKINLMVGNTIAGEGVFHIDTFDLYSAKQRQHYIQQAARETGIAEELVRHDLGRILLLLETLQHQQINSNGQTDSRPAVPAMSDAERDAALTLLQTSDLLERISSDMAACGLVGERTNTMVG